MTADRSAPRPCAPGHVLCLDLGGSSLKAGLFDPDGRQAALAAVPVSFEEDRAGRSEQDPGQWWRALALAVEDLAARPDWPGPPACIAICGFTRTQVFLGRDGRAVRPAISFRDSRALGPAQAALARPDVRAHADAGDLNPFHPLARLLWLAHHEREAWEQVRLVVEPKDYLNLRLTGQAASDPISLHWLARAMAGGAASLAAACGLTPGRLPPVVPAGGIVGRVQPGLPGALGGLAGVPVAQASTDTWTAVAGLGGLRAGRAYCISGTSEVVGLMAATPGRAEGLITMEWGEGLWQIGGPGQNGAALLPWITDLLSPGPAPFAERLERLLAARPCGKPLLFAPWLNGERTPYWDRDLRGAFLGLTPEHGAGDMVRAVMEGVALANRDVLSRAEAAAGQEAGDFRIAGGGARSALWNRIRADMLGRRVVASADAELGLLGCLAVARVALGQAPDFAAAADALPRATESFAPDPARRARADALFRTYREARDALARASHALAAIGREDFSDPSE
ncbi:carbohydrate kinase (plasmid) [Paroceanicella profunda]|uniref:Carbohydrate kinase n=1 Tax=Paroceanicella profunda TaxID=2579971 RepID=A0A5B8FIY6_9RHOB|nr:FGGY-family carbohydrate kinase [Paroceanicella profunda]QDL93837.1 carbohydrate kinase [Paroceanicella profunda]